MKDIRNLVLKRKYYSYVVLSVIFYLLKTNFQDFKIHINIYTIQNSFIKPGLKS